MTFTDWWKENGQAGYHDANDWFEYVTAAYDAGRQQGLDEATTIAKQPFIHTGEILHQIRLLKEAPCSHT